MNLTTPQARELIGDFKNHFHESYDDDDAIDFFYKYGVDINIQREDKGRLPEGFKGFFFSTDALEGGGNRYAPLWIGYIGSSNSFFMKFAKDKHFIEFWDNDNSSSWGVTGTFIDITKLVMGNNTKMFINWMNVDPFEVKS